ncbi:MAG TPA: hypothetical protein QF772_10660 [Nitrospinaceae bacterium]|nr:hypothetical protein [Nitrospinaceae bacterium]
MKFTKSEDSSIFVVQELDGQEKDFAYVGMVKELLNSGPMDSPKLEGDFSKEEIVSINSMVKYINKAIEEYAGDEGEDSVT